MSELTRLPAIELQGLLNAGEVSAQEVTQAHLNRIAEVEGSVKAFLHVSENALAEAQAIDAQRVAGESSCDRGLAHCRQRRVVYDRYAHHRRFADFGGVVAAL